MLTFPTRPIGRGAYVPGTPQRATACHCGNQAIVTEPGECSRCGHYTQATINSTWRHRASTVARQQALAKHRAEQRKAAA